MILSERLVALFVLAGMAMPAALLVILGMASLAARPVSERATGLLVRVAFTASVLAFALVAATMVPTGLPKVAIDLGRWFGTGEYAFRLRFQIDRLSLPMAGFTAVLCGVVGAFAHSYLHREAGYARFFLLLSVFATGMNLVVLSGSIGVVVAGWELVGLSSTLLIGFFYERRQPVKNAFRTFVVYRATDACLVGAAVLVHHHVGSGSFDAFLGHDPWPGGISPLSPGAANVIAALVLVAAMGKSAQIPFSGWLPRAMEGPTPSSAIFYGALSIHAGAYLLLRAAPLLVHAPAVSIATVLVGAATAMHATLVGRVQTDIKSALAYAALTQVGIIFVEIGLGLRYLALLHIIGHACVRSLQFLRAPTLLHDMHQLENAVGARRHRQRPALLARLLRPDGYRWLYRFALERARLDAFVDRWLVEPPLKLLRRADAFERRVVALAAGSTDGAGDARSATGVPRA